MGSRIRTIAACNKSVQDEIDSMTTAELHYRLGKALEDRPGVLLSVEHRLDTDKRHFEGLSLDARVNMDCINRLGEHAARARAEMGEEKWAELQAEWDDET